MHTDISVMMDIEALYDAHRRSFGAKRVSSPDRGDIPAHSLHALRRHTDHFSGEMHCESQ